MGRAARRARLRFGVDVPDGGASMAIRVLTVLAAIFAATLGIRESNAQQAAVAAAPPDTGISCPVGFVRVMQLHAWALSTAAAERLFGDSTARALRSGWKAFRAQELKKRIAKLAAVDAAEIRGGWAAQAFFGESRFKKSYLDSTGNGLAILIRDTEAGLVGSACVIADGVVRTDVGPLPVVDGRSMVIGVSLGANPHALALRIATVPSKTQPKEAQAFRDGVMKVAAPTVRTFFPTKVTAAIDSCLNRPTAGAGAGHGGVADATKPSKSRRRGR